MHCDCFYCLSGVRCGHLSPSTCREASQGCEAEGVHGAIWPVFCWDKCIPGTQQHVLCSHILCCFVLHSHEKKKLSLQTQDFVRFPRAFHLGCCSLSLLPDDVPIGLTPPSSLQRSSLLPEALFKINKGGRSQEDKGLLFLICFSLGSLGRQNMFLASLHIKGSSTRAEYPDE